MAPELETLDAVWQVRRAIDALAHRHLATRLGHLRD
jgi:hypothetical protein